MPVIPDASPLILLAKIERAELLAKLYGQVIVTPWVWEEAVARGKAMGASDAAYPERMSRELALTLVRPTAAERASSRRIASEGALGRGEAEVLAIARRRDVLAVLDDKDARAVAVGLGVAHVGTAGVLFEAFMRKLLSYTELLGLLEDLGEVAWITPDLIAGLIRRARGVDEEWRKKSGS